MNAHGNICAERQKPIDFCLSKLFYRKMPDLEHLTAFEHPEDHQGGDDHEDKGEDPGPGRGAEPPEAHVHSEEAGYQGRRHEHQ